MEMETGKGRQGAGETEIMRPGYGDMERETERGRQGDGDRKRET